MACRHPWDLLHNLPRPDDQSATTVLDDDTRTTRDVTGEEAERADVQGSPPHPRARPNESPSMTPGYYSRGQRRANPFIMGERRGAHAGESSFAYPKPIIKFLVVARPTDLFVHHVRLWGKERNNSTLSNTTRCSCPERHGEQKYCSMRHNASVVF